MPERLDKLISSQTTRSRRETAACIRRGAVTVDGRVERDPSAKVDPSACLITVEGQPLSYRRYVYVMMNKPAGIVCVSRDPRERTVVDLLPPQWRQRGLFPAGRLDKDTTGMVILTDDGDFAHRMLAPRRHVPKRYRARLDGTVTSAVCEAFAGGMTLANGEVCLPALCEPQGEHAALVTLNEGKYHQIKRMFAACGLHVTALERLSMGALALDPSLEPGEYRLMTEQEIQSVFLPPVW